MQRKWETATGCALRQGYGLTEAAPVSLFNRVDLPNRLGTLGVAYPGAQVSIRDNVSNAALPVGASGEIARTRRARHRMLARAATVPARFNHNCTE